MVTVLLDADGLRAALAGTPWREVEVHVSVDSTNLEALRHPMAWRVVAAGHQSAGRGRMARYWESPPGTSVSVSALVPVPADRPQDWGWLPLLTGMAARAAVLAHGSGSLEVGLKWPNDVLVRPAGGDGASPWGKVAGILCETAPSGGEPVVVVGTGFNVAQRPEDLPASTATSLAACGVDVGEGERRVRFATGLVAEYLSVLAQYAVSLLRGGDGLAALRAEYATAGTTVGRRVAVHQVTGETVVGTAAGLDGQGRLVVRRDGGGEAAYAAGDVEHLR